MPAQGGREAVPTAQGLGKPPISVPRGDQGWCLSYSWCPHGLAPLRMQLLCPCTPGLVSLSAQNELCMLADLSEVKEKAMKRMQHFPAPLQKHLTLQ